MTIPPHLLEDGLDVPEVIDQIGKDDEVKGLIESALVDVGLHEGEVGISPAGAGEHFARKIDADANRRFYGGEQVALAHPNSATRKPGATRNR